MLGRISTCQICRYDRNLAGSHTLCSQRRPLSVFLEKNVQQFLSTGIKFQRKAFFLKEPSISRNWEDELWSYFSYIDENHLSVEVWLDQQRPISMFSSVRLKRRLMFRRLTLRQRTMLNVNVLPLVKLSKSLLHSYVHHCRSSFLYIWYRLMIYFTVTIFLIFFVVVVLTLSIALSNKSPRLVYYVLQLLKTCKFLSGYCLLGKIIITKKTFNPIQTGLFGAFSPPPP